MASATTVRVDRWIALRIRNRRTRLARSANLPPRLRGGLQGEAAAPVRSSHVGEPRPYQTLNPHCKLERERVFGEFSGRFPPSDQRKPGNATRAFVAVASRTRSNASPRTSAIARNVSITFAGSLSRP